MRFVTTNELEYSAIMPDGILPPLVVFDLLALLACFVAGIIVESGITLLCRNHRQKPADLTTPFAVFPLLLLYWYNFIIKTNPESSIPEVLFPATVLATVFIVLFLVLQNFTQPRIQALLSIWSTGLILLLQLLTMLQTNSIDGSNMIQLFLVGMLTVQFLPQVRALINQLH